MEKTAMQELIEWYDETNKRRIKRNDFVTGSEVIMKAEELIIKERQQIEDAYKQGRKDDVLDYYPEKHASEYYEETYGK